jgi:hypothetical protein
MIDNLALIQGRKAEIISIVTFLFLLCMLKISKTSFGDKKFYSCSFRNKKQATIFEKFKNHRKYN